MQSFMLYENTKSVKYAADKNIKCTNPSCALNAKQYMANTAFM